MDWMDLSQNITPPRAPCGANNGKFATKQREFKQCMKKFTQ